MALDRGKPFRATRSLAAAADHIRNGTSVAAFPEGTRSRDGSVGRFKRGSFVIALKARVPLVPLSIVGVKRVAPGGLLTLRPGSVRLRIHPAVHTVGRSPDDAEALAEDVRRVVRQGLFGRLRWLRGGGEPWPWPCPCSARRPPASPRAAPSGRRSTAS